VIAEFKEPIPAQEHQDRIDIIIADDHPLLRSALRNVLEKESDFNIIAEAADGEEAIRLATELSPNVIIMDISMPGVDGLVATRQIKEKCPDTAILILTIYEDSEHILAILEAGASGYLTKSVFGEEVICAIRGVSAGETVLSSEVSKQVIGHAIRYKVKPLLTGSGEKLTEREMLVLKLTARGLSNKEIAEKLNLSPRTVKGYLAEVFSKLGVSSRTQAVICGLREGHLTVDDIE
jgi:DNA-binding NarL/FixJ family response regulator